MTGQRDMVRASLLAPIASETHHDVYGKRRARLTSDPVTVQAVTRSIRDLGELLHEAASDAARAWLVLRLQNRLDVLEALMARGGQFSRAQVTNAERPQGRGTCVQHPRGTSTGSDGRPGGHTSPLAERAVRCTGCDTTRPESVIDCPVCDVPRGHVHGKWSA